MPPLVEYAGWFSLVPAATVFVLALLTRRSFEALLGGTLIGCVLTSGFGFFDAFADSMQRVMQNGTVGWIVLVVGLFGSLMAVNLPMVVPLASSMDVSMPLVLGAVISAGSFGSHACFDGDTFVLAASSSG